MSKKVNTDVYFMIIMKTNKTPKPIPKKKIQFTDFKSPILALKGRTQQITNSLEKIINKRRNYILV